MSADTATPTPTRPVSSQSDRELQAQLLGIAPVLKPGTSTIGRWLNRLFVIVVLIAIPLAYYFGYIGVAWLNRIGIILNFFAGFMVAPELFGVERIKRLRSVSKPYSLL